MKRRTFLSLLGAAAAGGPVAARAQQGARIRRIGVLAGTSEDDPQTKAVLVGFRQGLERLGWIEGRNLHIDQRFTGGKIDQIPVLAKELVALQPEVILSQGTAITAALRNETSTIPIVFVAVSDPIGSGFIDGLARPGRNITGVLMYEVGITGKWLAMLKEVAPQTKRAALIASPTTAYDYFVRAATAAAPTVGLELVPFKVRNADEIERALESFAQAPDGGLVLPPDNTMLFHRAQIIALASRHRLPAVYALRVFVAGGGLMSYGTANVEIHRNAAAYFDRIFKGAKPADLPVQVPAKYETVINQKTAKALGLTIPSGMLVAADEVIE